MSNPDKGIEILFPVGRLVWGDLYTAREKDDDGQPLTVKSGPNKGQPTKVWSFGVAYPKAAGETHWAQTEWGAKIWAEAHRAWPQGQPSRHDFAFKVTDGDSQVPNKKGKKPCEQEGFPGHWVVAFSSNRRAPNIYNRDGTQIIQEAGAVKRGYYVQVFGNVKGNNSSQTPGMYINHDMVALAAYGEEIITRRDATAVGFGQGALPVGAMATPAAGMSAPPVTPPTPSAPAPTYTPPPAPPVVSAPPVPAAPAPQPTPHYAVLGVPGQPNHVPPNGYGAPPAPSAPPAPPAPPAAPAAPVGPQMTAAAQFTYDQYKQSGWTDDMLRQNGLMV